MVTRGSPKPLLRVRILLPLPVQSALKPLGFKALFFFFRLFQKLYAARIYGSSVLSIVRRLTPDGNESSRNAVKKTREEREEIEMKKVFGIMMVLMMAIGLMLPVFASAQSVEGHDYMWVNCADGKTLNVRQAPNTNAGILYRVECGTKLFIIESVNNEWAHVWANGKSAGYVMTKFLVAEKPGKYEITEREDNFRKVTPYKVTALARGKNTQESVGLRVKPNKTAKMVRRLMAGDTLEVIAVGKVWSQVKDPQTGKTGYVANDYIVKK